MSDNLEINLEKSTNVFEQNESILFSINTRRNEQINEPMKISVRIDYQIKAYYKYSTSYSFLDKEYTINKTFRQDNDEGTEVVPDGNTYNYSSPKTGYPTLNYQYPHQNNSILDIQIRCYLSIFNNRNKLAQIEIQIKNKYPLRNQNHEGIHMGEIEENNQEKAWRFNLQTKRLACQQVQNQLYKPYSVGVKISNNILFRNTSIELIIDDNPTRMQNEVSVTCQLCLEFMIIHKTFLKNKLHAYPRIILSSQRFVNQNGLWKANIILPDTIDSIIPPIFKNEQDLHCLHYIIVGIKFPERRFFRENDCEIKIPIEIIPFNNNSNEKFIYNKFKTDNQENENDQKSLDNPISEGLKDCYEKKYNILENSQAFYPQTKQIIDLTKNPHQIK